MNFLFPELELDALRESGGAAEMARPAAMGRAGGTPADGLDLDDPQQNLMAMLKIRGDISGRDFFFAFPGEAWAMVPGDGNFRLFKTFGVGAGRFEKAEEGWRILSREVLYYLDPVTRQVLTEWNNPLLGGRKVEVVPISNDPVNGVFTAGGRGPLSAPYPYVAYGDDIIFQWNFFIHKPNPLNRREYPRYSAGDMDMHAELWGIQGHRSDVLNPDITAAPATISWSRVTQWLPFMEMGNSAGIVVFHSHSYKLTGGLADLPRDILDYTEKHYPKYLEAPRIWRGREMQSTYEVFKERIDRRRAAGEER